MLRNVLALVGVISLVGISAVAVNAQGWSLENAERPPSMRVSFAGLDLTSPAGQQILAQRINTAVIRVCGEADTGDIWARALQTRCRRAARRSTEAQVAEAIDRAHQRALAVARADETQTASLH